MLLICLCRGTSFVVRKQGLLDWSHECFVANEYCRDVARRQRPVTGRD